jgi:hypothetical protein
MRAPRRGLPLAAAITLALIVKLIILSLLWKAFFSQPQAKKMRLPTAQVEQHLLNNPDSPPSPARRFHDPDR